MKRFLCVSASIWLIQTLSFAQPVSPTLADVERLRAMSQIDPRMAAAGEPWTVNTALREETRQFYRSIYFASEGVPMGWTGDVTTGVAGTTSAEFKEAVRVRVNFFRAMGGVPALVTMNSTFSGKNQDAALMMSANNTLNHFPPTTWTYYTAGGAEAAAASNIALGVAGPDAITGYMADPGSNNTVVGHRRWIVYPQTQEMGTGDVAGGGGFSPANALWVQDANIFAARPTTRDPFVAYPNKGHNPYSLVFPRWSFSYPGANFASATVTMTSGGVAVPVAIESRNSGGGAPENTIVWAYNGLNTDSATPHPRPLADTTYTVNVNGVIISGSPQNFSYDVIVFDPDVAGGGFTATTVSGSASPAVGAANAYSVAKPSFASQFQWRSMQFMAFSTTYGAEGDLQGVVAGISAGYNARVTDVVAAGNGAYHLAHPSPPTSQTLTVPGSYFLPTGGSGTLTFRSRLGFATDVQVARVQISTDDGNAWSDVYTQAGTGNSGEGSFVLRNVDLAAYAGMTFQVRFAYTFTTGSFFNQTTSNAGWLIDSITMTGVQSATTGTISAATAGSSFNFTPGASGDYGLQARGVLFTAYPLDWGTVSLVTATTSVPKTPATVTLSNLSRTYTAAPLSPSAATTPGGLTVGFTFNGSATAPSAVGTYALVATINDATYEGTANGTFTIVPALALGNAGPIATSAGGATAFSITAIGSVSQTYQWQMQAPGGGAWTNVAGATGAAYSIPSTQRFHAGSYRVVVTANGVTATSDPVVLSIPAPVATSARLLNLSTRGLSTSGDDVLIPGFVIEGTGTKRLLIRAVGPTLGVPPFGLNGVVPDPRMDLKVFNPITNANDDVVSNDDWGTNANAAEIVTVAADLFAFSLTEPKDAALLVDLPPGRYSVIARDGTNTSGIAIVEVYDADTSGATSRLINISNRGFSGVGGEVMIPGFVVSSEGPKTLLIRVVGPTLGAAPFNVPGTMADPKLLVFGSVNGANTEILSQDNWEASPDAAYTSAIAQQVFAFALNPGSLDAAFVVTLNPGVYTIWGTSASGSATGVVLVEVYVVP